MNSRPTTPRDAGTPVGESRKGSSKDSALLEGLGQAQAQAGSGSASSRPSTHSSKEALTQLQPQPQPQASNKSPSQSGKESSGKFPALKAAAADLFARRPTPPSLARIERPPEPSSSAHTDGSEFEPASSRIGDSFNQSSMRQGPGSGQGPGAEATALTAAAATISVAGNKMASAVEDATDPSGPPSDRLLATFGTLGAAAAEGGRYAKSKSTTQGDRAKWGTLLEKDKDGPRLSSNAGSVVSAITGSSGGTGAGSALSRAPLKKGASEINERDSLRRATAVANEEAQTGGRGSTRQLMGATARADVSAGKTAAAAEGAGASSGGSIMDYLAAKRAAVLGTVGGGGGGGGGGAGTEEAEASKEPTKKILDYLKRSSKKDAESEGGGASDAAGAGSAPPSTTGKSGGILGRLFRGREDT